MVVAQDILLFSWAYALLFVVLTSTSILGYACLAKRLFTPLSFGPCFAVGLGLLTSLMLLTGVLGLFISSVQTLIVVVGLVLFWRYRRTLPRLPTLSRADWLWLIWPLLYFTSRFFACGVPQQHSDALYYHLLGPKLWVEAGRVALTAAHPSLSQATLFETLYALPQLWLGTIGLKSHVITQLYGQWMHMIWGQIASLVAGVFLLRRLTPGTGLGLSVFAAWICTSQPAFEWLGCLAKNDYIMMMFILFATLAALEKHWLAAGVLVGFAFSTKFLAAWFAIALLVLIPPRFWIHYLAAALVGFIPLLLRNVVSAGNPLFPMFDNVIGPHWISSWWNDHNQSFGGAVRFDAAMLGWLWTRALEKALPKIILALGVLAVAWQWFRLRKAPQWRWALFLFIQLALGLLMLRPLADGRYLNYVCALMALGAMAAVLRLRLLNLKLARLSAPLILALGILLNTPVDTIWKIPRDYLFSPADKYVAGFHPVYDAQTWVHENVDSKDQVLWLAEKQHFYLDRPFETVVEMKKWQLLLTPLQTFEELARVAREQGYRYVHFSPHAGPFPSPLRPFWDKILALSGKAVFRSPTSLIFDLKSLGSE